MRFNVKGIKLPINPPNPIFISMAIHTIREKSILAVVMKAIAAPRAPIKIPLISPFAVPLIQTLRISKIPTSPRARERTVTANVWAPVFPPIPAMIGIKTASSGRTAMLESKIPTTNEAIKAVIRFTNSHGVTHCQQA